MDSRETVALSHDDIERAGRFRIGDAVTVVHSDSKSWTADWSNTKAIVWGIRVERDGKIEITVMHDGDQVSDGFEPEDLAALRTAGTGRAETVVALLRESMPTISRHGDEIVLYCPDGTITDDLYSALERACDLPTQPAGGARGD